MFSRLKLFKEVLCPQKALFCAFLFASTLHAHKSMAPCLNALRSVSGKDYSHTIHLDENFVRVGDSTVRLAPNVELHTVVFDIFGSEGDNFSRSENKLTKLNGAEAFSPIAKFKSDSEAAEWMAQRLREVKNQNWDSRPVVAYIRGDMAEAAALLSQNHPDLVQGLVIENPLSSNSQTTTQTTGAAQTPTWTTNPFRVPTFILTGTHDTRIPGLQKQKLFDLARLNHLKRLHDLSLPALHYMDMPFGTEDVFASTAKNLAHEEASHFIRRHILKDPSIDKHTVAPSDFVKLAQTQGIGPRRFLGHNPKVTPENEFNAIQAGMFMWEHGLKAVGSVDEARAHIEKMKRVTSKKKNAIINSPLFFITNATELGAINKSAHLDDALSNISGDPKNLIRNAINDGGEFFWIDEKNRIQKFDPALISDVPIEAIFHEDDGNGFMFNLSGWTLPTIRGVLDIETAKDSRDYNRRGINHFYGVKDRGGRLQKKGLVHEGFHFKKNTNLSGVLEKLRGMHRKGQSDNATRFIDPYNIALMQRLYEQDRLETHELYNGKGELVAGSIVVKIGKMWSPETVFYPSVEDLHPGPNAPHSQNLDGVDYAKIVVSYTIDEAVKEGHTVLDTQVVSPLSNGFGADYESTDAIFLPLLHETNDTWAERQQNLEAERAQKAEEKAQAKERYDALVEASSVEIATLESRIAHLQGEIIRQKGIREANLIEGDVTEAVKEDPKIAARIQTARAAGKEARKLQQKELDPVEEELNTLLTGFRKQSEEREGSAVKAPEPTIEDAQAKVDFAERKYSIAKDLLKTAKENEENAERALDGTEPSQQAYLAAQKKAKGIEDSLKASYARLIEALALLQKLKPQE